MAAPPIDLAAICESGEAAARKHILSKVDRQLIRDLNILVSTEKEIGKTKGTVFSVEVSIDLDPVVDMDVEKLADEATDAALAEIDLKMKAHNA